MIPSIQCCLISTGILPTLPPDCSVSPFLMNDSKTTSCGERRRARRDGVTSPSLEQDITKEGTGDLFNHMFWFIYAGNMINYEWRMFSLFCPMRKQISDWKSNIHICKCVYLRSHGCLFLQRSPCVPKVQGWTSLWQTKKESERERGKASLSLNFQQCSHLKKTRPFINSTTNTPNLSSSSFDLSVWLWGVLYPWIMVMCCSQWMLIMHANEHTGAEEEGDEGKGVKEAEVLALMLIVNWNNTQATAVCFTTYKQWQLLKLIVFKLSSVCFSHK